MNRSRYARSNYRSSIVSGITTKDPRVCCYFTVVIMILSQNLLIRGLKCMLKPISGSPTLIHYLRSEWRLPCSLKDTEGVAVSTATPVIIASLVSPVCMKPLKLSRSTLLLLSTVLSQLLFSPGHLNEPQIQRSPGDPMTWLLYLLLLSIIYLLTCFTYLMTGIGALIRKDMREMVSLCLCLSLYHMWIQWKGGISKPGKGPSPEPDQADTMISNFQAPRTIWNKFLRL